MEMSEYISREAANEACREAVRRYPNSFYNGIEAARDAIRKLPAADVRPVVRGKWNNIFGEVPGTTNFTVSLPQCSECGFVFNWNSPYCPNCGAEMRPTSMSGANLEES